MKIKMMIVLVLLIVAVVACSSVSSGTVLDKHFEPYHITLIPLTVPFMHFMIINHPDTYSLLLEDCNKNSCIKGWITVDKNVYNSTEIGSFIRLKGK